MQTLRLSLAGLAAIALLAGTSITALAQDDEATTTPVVVSGTLECLDSTTTDDEAMGQSVVTVHAWEATDERLSGEVSYGGRWQLYEQPSEDSGSVESAEGVAAYEIVNEGGTWMCEAARAAAPRSGEDAHTLVFNGEDGYEGLTAYLQVDWSTSPYQFSGLILPGEAPPYAEPAQ